MSREGPKESLIIKVKNGFDNYRLSTLFGLPIAIILMLISLGVARVLGFEDLVKTSALMIDFVVIPSFIARFISASSYIGRLRDAWGVSKAVDANYEQLGPVPKVATVLSGAASTDRVIGFWERWATTLGVLLGIVVGVSAAALHAAVPLLGSLNVVAYPLYVGGFIGIIGGLFNRVGVSIDGKRDKTEMTMMCVGAALGFALSVAMLATSSAALAIIPGVTPFIAGAAFPAWLGAATFVLIASSIFASAADYLGKSVSYFRSFFDAQFNQDLIPRLHEHRGALLGVVLGTGMGLAVVLTLPLSGLAGAAIGSLIILTCMGVMGGLVARTARLADRLYPCVVAPAPTVAGATAGNCGTGASTVLLGFTGTNDQDRQYAPKLGADV